MKKIIILSFLVASFFVVGYASAASSSTQIIYLNSGWNIISTPKVVESHQFSITENSTNFDIYILNASSTSGWSTMAELGQTEFMPLFGYFINNKTSSTETLTLTYKENLNPNERLFERTLTQTGWYSIGVANPTYAKQQYENTTDTNNISNILNSLSGKHSTVIDFTDENYSSVPSSVRVGNIWKAVTPNDLNSLNDLRETKGYAIYITNTNALYNGFQNEGNASSTPILSPTVSKATSSPSGNIFPGSQNAVLAVFDVKAGGEALEIRRIGIQILTQTAGLELTGTVTVRDADTSETYLSLSADTVGMQVSSTAPTTDTLLTYQRNLSSYINLANGQTKRIEVLGTVRQTATSTSSYLVYTGQYYAKRLSSNDYATFVTSTVQGNTLTVKAVTVSVNKDTSMPDSTRTRGASNVLVGQVVLTASGDNVRVNSISIDIATSSNFQNVLLKDGETQLGNTIGNPTDTGNSFSLSDYILEKEVAKVISVWADVVPNAATTSIVSVSASGISGSGVNSSVSLSSTPATATALQTITLGTPSVTIAADDDQPISKIVFAGNSAEVIHKIKFTAVNEDLTLKKITLLIQTASTTVWTATSSTANFGTVYIYEGTTLRGSNIFNSSDGTVAITLSGANAITLLQGTEKVLTVKANINGQDAIVPKTVSALRLYSSSTSDLEIYSSAGLMDTGITVTDNALSNYHLYTVSAPVIASVTSGSLTGTKGANVEIGRFTISNPGTRSITLSSTTFAIMLDAYTATSSITGFKLYKDGNSTALATDNTVITSTSTSATSNITLDGFSPTQTIAAGGTNTYILKASTTAISNGTGGTIHPIVQVSIRGSAQYDSTDVTSSPSGEELYWADGVVLYSYTTTVGGVTTYSNLLGTDTVDLYGPTYTY